MIKDLLHHLGRLEIVQRVMPELTSSDPTGTE